MHQAKLNNILGLSAQERYGYLIRRAADFEEVWLIRDDTEFVTLADAAEQAAVVVFPEREFAEQLLVDEWQLCVVEQVRLDDFYSLLDNWQKQQIKVAGFPGADLNSVVVTAEEMKNHLLHESQQYE